MDPARQTVYKAHQRLVRTNPLSTTMARFKALIQETWWLWIVFGLFGGVMAFLSPVFLLMFPISIFTFFWFAYIRYDEDGNFKGS